MLKIHYRLILKCALIAPLIYILHLSGILTHLFEKDYKEFFCYAVNNEFNYRTPRNVMSNYTILIEPNKVTQQSPRLTILIKSAINNVNRRSVIRSTWGFERRFSDVTVKRVFLLGVNSYKTEMARINEEALQYHDILQMNFIDTYFNNTLKTMMGIYWSANFFKDSDYYMFVDDDYYVSIKNTLRFLTNVTNEHKRKTLNPIDDHLLYAGYVLKTSPHRHKWSKWHVSLQEYPFDMWPPYVTAGAFILSRNAISKMFAVSKTVPYFRFDDIYLSIVALKADIQLSHCSDFHFYRPPYSGSDSYQNVIASHGFHNSFKLKKVWSECRESGYA